MTGPTDAELIRLLVDCPDMATAFRRGMAHERGDLLAWAIRRGARLLAEQVERGAHVGAAKVEPAPAPPRRFPVLGKDGKRVPPVPWGLLAPHEEQAQRNHGQTLEQLAGRGGLGASEMLAILERRPFRAMAPEESCARLTDAINAWNVKGSHDADPV